MPNGSDCSQATVSAVYKIETLYLDKPLKDENILRNKNGLMKIPVKPYRVIQGGEEINFSSDFEAVFHESLQSESMNTLD
jgi:hypothetical protein